MEPDHEHEFLGTFLRAVNGEEFVIYSGERPTDRFVLMCDCGESYPPHVDSKNNDHRPRPFSNKVSTNGGLAVCADCGGALPVMWVGNNLLRA